CASRGSGGGRCAVCHAVPPDPLEAQVGAVAQYGARGTGRTRNQSIREADVLGQYNDGNPECDGAIFFRRVGAHGSHAHDPKPTSVEQKNAAASDGETRRKEQSVAGSRRAFGCSPKAASIT